MKVDHLKMIDRLINLHPDIFEQIFGKLGSIDLHFLICIFRWDLIDKRF